MTDHLALLIAYQKWRRGDDIPQPDPKEIGRALDWAIKELEKKAKRGPVHNPKRTP